MSSVTDEKRPEVESDAGATGATTAASVDRRTLRNMTPDRLTLTNADGASVVFAPLEERTLDARVQAWPWDELLRREIVAWLPERPVKSLEPVLVGVGWGAVAVGWVLYKVAVNTTYDDRVVWGAGIVLYAVLVAGAVALFRQGGATVTRQTAQMVMFVLVLIVSVGVPLVAALRFAQEDLWAETSLAVVARFLQVLFAMLAAMLPALLYFHFDRQRLSTLRDRFERQIFRLDPNVTTLSDVHARYGSQMEETFNHKGGRDDSRLARQRRGPILVATMALSLGWILTLMPVGVLTAPTGPADLAALFAPLQNPLAFGFLGAYFFSINLVLRRYARGDLRAKAYSAITVRVIVVIVLAWLIDATVPDADNWVLAVAFLVGVVPETILKFLRETFRDRLIAAMVNGLEEAQPLQQLEGLDLYDRARLQDEGVANVESLAHHDLVDLLLETRIPVGRLVDWVDQAILYLHVVDPFEGDNSAGHRVRGRLRALGIRGATDLEAARELAKQDPAVMARLTGALERDGDGEAVPGVTDLDQSRLGLLVASLGDDEWMCYVRNWRRRSMLYERWMSIDEAGVSTADVRCELALKTASDREDQRPRRC